MRRVIALPVAVALASVGVAFAAGLAVDGNSVGAGTAVVGRCDDAATVTYTTSGSTVTHVVVSDLSNDCDGAALTLVVVGSAGSQVASGTATVPTDTVATSITVPITPNLQSSAVAGVRIAMVGP